MEEQNNKLSIGPAQDLDLVIDTDLLSEEDSEEQMEEGEIETKREDFTEVWQIEEKLVDKDLQQVANLIASNVREKLSKLVFRNVDKVQKRRDHIVYGGITYYYILPRSFWDQVFNVLKTKDLQVLIDFIKEESQNKENPHWQEYRDVLNLMAENPMTQVWQITNLYGSILKRRYNTLEHATKETPVRYHHNLAIEYSQFYGFTSSTTLNKLDPYPNRQIIFKSDRFAEISFSEKSFLEFEPTSRHPFAPRHQLNKPGGKIVPGQLLCGIVAYENKGPSFTKWFVCSSQFYKLWLMLFDPTNETLATGLKDQIKDLSTLKIWNLYSMNLNKRLEKYDHRVFEKVAMEYGDRYQILANICFNPNYIYQWKQKSTDRIAYNKAHPLFPIIPFYEEKLIGLLVQVPARRVFQIKKRY